MSDEMPVGKAYAYDLLNAWCRIRLLSDEMRRDMLRGRQADDKYSEYISLMIGMWVELYPKIRNRSEFGEAIEFEEYEKAYIDPDILFKDPKSALKLQMLLRTIIEKLKITDFEGTSI